MSEVRVDVADRVALVTLDAAERRNSLTLETVSEIVAAFDELEGNRDVGAVIITGAPPAFCAGASLAHLGAETTEEQDHRAGLRAIYEGFLRVGRSTLPTIAAVNGAAVGAGMNLALACDLRVAARRARFDTRFLQLGLHPGGGHTWMFQRIAGPQAAAAAVLFGEVLSGEEAQRCGLVWRCVDDDTLLDEARRLAGAAASGPPALVERIKATLAAMPSVTDVEAAVDIELEAQSWSMNQPDFAERLAALQAKVSRKG
ncbi:MAG TPA: enoyl-CoA hydratase [Acidimicrobiales bacterium]|nr:enoyl-CoA hydratase [Acidimicrobiales bacterium]